VLFGFEFGDWGPLTVRRAQISLGLPRRVSILYASDLHLGHWWTNRVPAQLRAVIRESQPDVVLLGGDLVDRRDALPVLQNLIAEVAAQATVGAIPGNHDARVGISEVRQQVLAAGACWLPDEPLEEPLGIDAVPCPSPSAGRRVLCAHFPSIFPTAVAAGYRLVLAGHLHGGQCVLATYRNKLYPAVWIHRWHGLWFREQEALMLVSRGVGDTFPFRFNCPREVLLCELS
jgi:predicted MPP superfamily phosphohydrolase